MRDLIAQTDFTEWLCREMPANTIIGDPKWWAPRIYRAVCRAQAKSIKPGTNAETEQWKRENL